MPRIYVYLLRYDEYTYNNIIILSSKIFAWFHEPACPVDIIMCAYSNRSGAT